MMIIKKLTMNWKPDLHANIVGKPQVYDSLDVYVDVALIPHRYLPFFIYFIYHINQWLNYCPIEEVFITVQFTQYHW